MIKLDLAHKKFINTLKEQGKTSSTLVAYNKDIEQLMDHLSKEGLELVSQIEINHLENFMGKLAKENYTPKSISRKTNATKTFFRFLVSEGHIKLNVADQLKHPKIDVRAPRILTVVEYRALRDAARDDSRSYAMIEVLLQAGLTISELSDMKLDDLKIHNETGNLFVPKRNNKEARNVPINKSVMEAIKKYLNEERPKIENAAHVFITKSGKSLLVRNIRSTINRFFKLAGIVKAKVNDLRHTFVAHNLASGVNILTLSRIAGHKRITTTERYLQYIEKNGTDEKQELSIL